MYEYKHIISIIIIICILKYYIDHSSSNRIKSRILYSQYQYQTEEALSIDLKTKFDHDIYHGKWIKRIESIPIPNFPKIFDRIYDNDKFNMEIQKCLFDFHKSKSSSSPISKTFNYKWKPHSSKSNITEFSIEKFNQLLSLPDSILSLIHQQVKSNNDKSMKRNDNQYQRSGRVLYLVGDSITAQMFMSLGIIDIIV